MSLKYLWAVCDVAFQLEVKTKFKERRQYLARLSELVGTGAHIPDDLSGNGVCDEALAVFLGLASLVEKSLGHDESLITAFYKLNQTIRRDIQAYCKSNNIGLVALIALPLTGKPKTGLRGDKDFVHANLPYKEG